MMNRKSSIVGLAVVAFCAWQCHELPGVWLHAPFDRFGWLAFLLWIFPVALGAIRGVVREANDGLLLAAAALSLLGAAADLNVLQHAGLTAALAAFAPLSRGLLIVWMCAACAWMPVFGWFGSALGLSLIAVARIAIAGGAALWVCRAIPAKVTPTTATVRSLA